MAQAVTRWVVGAEHEVLLDRLVGPRLRGRMVDLVLVVLAAALLALATQIRIPLGFTPVPLTGQTFAVLLIGAGLGPIRGMSAVLVYLAVGLLGAPVFSEGGSGTTHLLGATGGYLIGFVLAAGVAGWMARRGADRRVWSGIAAMTAASLVVYVCGVIGLVLVTGASVPRAIELGVLPFLVVDVVKAAAAGILLPATWRVVDQAGRR